jgi:cell division protein FtsL
MATVLRAERQPNVRTRVHSDGGVMARPMVRTTVGITPVPRTQLTVVPRRRRTARLVTVAAFFISCLMLSAAAFQTQLARRQVELDRLGGQIRTARSEFDDLRQRRAELRSPERLATTGTLLGMRAATKTEFIAIDPAVVAEVQQSAGGVFDPGSESSDPIFEEFKVVKSIAGG